jgi:hypothetical protein
MLNRTSYASLRQRDDEMQDEIRNYAELQEQMHDALREQHPDWVDANGECSACQLYERRFAEQLERLAKNPPARPSDTIEAKSADGPPRDSST